MKTALRLLVVVTLLVAAFGFYAWGHYERKISDAEEALNALNLQKAGEIYDGLLGQFRYMAYLPRPLDRPYEELHERRADLDYLKKEYLPLVGNNAEHVLAETNPTILLTRTNALYRFVRGAPSPSVMDTLIKSYARIVEQDPSIRDAAYNYEYLVRQRAASMRGKPKQGRDQQNAQSVDQNQKGDGDGQPGNQSALKQKFFGKEGMKIQDTARNTEKFLRYVPEGNDQKRNPADPAGKGIPPKKRG